jgi:nicotinamidase-related amidase
MKEQYFLPNSVEARAREYITEFRQSKHVEALSVFPQNLALLVLDMQEYFLDPASHAFVPSAKSIISGIQQLVDAFTKVSKPIFFTQHLNSLNDAGKMASWWHDLITPDNPLSAISSEFDAASHEVFQKTQYDAFYKTALGERLTALGITDVVISGVMTHLCCETTARSAFMRGFGVWFTVDGTATYNQEFHQATLRNISHGFAVPVLISEVINRLGEDEN